ncbi:MAG: DNA/RNA non-specific endonuclease [Bacteroidales bacterium]|nr:DNA/RNA non-specific endonuclease [Bacteroidales bacterium]
MRKKHKKFLLLAVSAAVTALAVWCCDEPLPAVDDSVTVSLRNPEVGNTSGSTFVSVKTAGAWTLSLSFEEGSEAWAELSMTSGKGEQNGIILTYEANPEDTERELMVEAKCGTNTSMAALTQAAGEKQTQNPEPVLKENKATGWLELPAIKDGDGLYFYWHDHVVGGKTMRSWSFDYDPVAMVSHWVAYPLNKGLIGSGSRTDEWGLDPKIPEEYQPVLYKGFKSPTDTRYDRGHQLPSADRYNYDANVQTFYFTNMTPQRHDFNGFAWADLEGRVREWSRSMDTLYVVTGCVVDGSSDYAYDNEGKEVTVPVAYYKALLGYKKDGTLGITAQTGGYTACAFWYDHKPYSGNVMNQSMTVAELEEKTGVDFFVNLPSVTDMETARKVESTKDDWWK